MYWHIVLPLAWFYIILSGIFLYWNRCVYRPKSYDKDTRKESKDILEAKGLDFRWIGIGVAYILTLQFFGGILLGILGTMSIGSILLIGALVYFFGGVIIGKQSPTKIVIEPALSALFVGGFSIVLGIIFKIPSDPMSNAFIITLIMITFFLAIVGEYVGKKWQGTIKTAAHDFGK